MSVANVETSQSGSDLTATGYAGKQPQPKERAGGESDPSFLYHPAENFEQMLSAFNIVYEQYLTNGYIAPRSVCFLYSLADILPHTVVFVAVSRGTIVGTMSTVVTPADQLPSWEMFSSELAELELQSSRVAEGTKFSCLPEVAKRAPYVARELVRHSFHWWHDVGLEHVFVVVHPRHSAFWRRTARFKPYGETKPCERVGGSPGVLMHLAVTSSSSPTKGIASGRRERFLRKQAGDSFSQVLYRFSEEEVAILLFLEPLVLERGPYISVMS